MEDSHRERGAIPLVRGYPWPEKKIYDNQKSNWVSAEAAGEMGGSTRMPRDAARLFLQFQYEEYEL